MKTYVKPTLEVISMKTSENIAATNEFKTIYKRAKNNDAYATQILASWSKSVDLENSAPASIALTEAEK